MRSQRFKSESFFGAVDSCRRRRQLTWREVAAQAQVSASTLSRMGRGARPDVETFACLCLWAELDANTFLLGPKRGSKQSRPLEAISAQLRGDPNLTPDAAGAIEDILAVSYRRLGRNNSRGRS